MARTDFIEPLRRRLLELGCPIAQVRRLVQEVADHREDLKQAALSEGLSEADAEVRANAQLGDPLALANQMMASLRQSSWWGRHFVIGFGVLPVLTVPVLWFLLFFLELALIFALGYGWDLKKLPAADNSIAIHHLQVAVVCAHYIAVAVVTLCFCWLARRAVVNFRWAVIACAICSLYASFSKGTLTPHSFQVGLCWSPDWIVAAIPFLIAGAIYILRRRKTQCFQEKIAV
jgi:hypothetical protein